MCLTLNTTIMKKFTKAGLKAEIKKQFGTVTKLKKFLKENATFQYGCYYKEIDIYGCKISYTSNENCFANFLIDIPHVGFNSQYGIGKRSITKAGKLRGCSNYYITL
jgi:hypothetical protein